MNAEEHRIVEATKLVVSELRREQANNKPFNSAHEGHSVIREEFEELWDEIKKKRCERSLERMAEEAIQVAAMGLRFYLDVCMKGKE